MKRASAILVLAALAALSTGCQTFSMTEEEFAKQQHGQCADPETGAVVGTVGDAAYQGAIIAGFVAMLFR